MTHDHSSLAPSDLLALVGSGRELAAEIDLPDLLGDILKKASALTDSPDTSVLLYDEERKGPYFAAATGASAPMLLERTFDLVKQLKELAHSERMSLFFADMREFTQLCQVLNSPDRIQELLTEFLTMLSDQVIQYGGVVNKFLGDGLFAFFRRNDSAHRAITCAAAIVERFSSLRGKWDHNSNQVLDFLDVGVGIVTDKVIIGTVGSSPIRDFTAIGTAVNLAAAFEQAARGGKRILVDQNTYVAAKDVAEFEGPFSHTLRKPDQRIGHPYKQYSLLRLKTAASKKVLLFISHSHGDREFVEASLTEPLARRGIGTWYSAADIRAGADFVKSIEEGLMKCDWMVVVVSESSVALPWVRREVSTAVSDPRCSRELSLLCLAILRWRSLVRCCCRSKGSRSETSMMRCSLPSGSMSGSWASLVKYRTCEPLD